MADNELIVVLDKTTALEALTSSNKVSSTKVWLDNCGKDLVSDWKAKAKAVDVNRKIMRDQLDELRQMARKPLSDWEEAEKKRIEGIEYQIEIIEAQSNIYKADGSGDMADSAELINRMAWLEGVEINDSFQEFAVDAAKAKDLAIRELRTITAGRVKQEIEQAELERLRQEEEARKKKEYEDKLKKEAAEKARKEAEAEARKEADRLEKEKKEAQERERRAIEIAKQAELDRIAADEKAKIDIALAAEKARLEEVKRREDEEAKAKAEQEARETNKRHVNSITKNAVAAIMQHGVVSEYNAKLTIEAIKDRKIPGIRIEY
jgi:hypothetical protein